MMLLLQSATDSGLREGLMALNRGDIAGARASLELAATREPKNAIVWAALARVYYQAGLKDKAVAGAEHAAELDPENPAIQHALAMFYQSMDEPGKAANYERKYSKSPNADRAAGVRAARLYMGAADPVAAAEVALDALRYANLASLHNILGQALEAQKLAPGALKEYREASLLEPENQEYRFGLVQALFRTERFAEAAALLESAVKDQPDSAQYQLALGVAYYGLRRFDEALQAFLKTIDLSPDTEQPYLFLAKMLDQAGGGLPAIETRFEQYRKRFPEGYLGSFLMAKALLYGDPGSPRIEILLRETISRKPDLWEAHADLSDRLSRKKDYRNSANELEIAAKLNPLEPSIPFRLARIFDRLQQSEKASEQRALHEKLLAGSTRGMGKTAP